MRVHPLSMLALLSVCPLCTCHLPCLPSLYMLAPLCVMPSLYASPSCVYPLTLTPLAFFPNLSTRHPPCVRTLSTRHSHVGTAHRGTAHIAPGLQAPTRGEGRDPKQTANTARPAGRQDNFDLRISTNAGHYLCDFIYFSSLAHLWKAGQLPPRRVPPRALGQRRPLPWPPAAS